MTLSSILWQANQDLAQACLQHPFVQGIAQGDLPRQRFSYYVGQDAFFLRAFARAYSVAAAKCTDWETFQVFHRLTQGVLEELQLHDSYSEDWQVNLTAVEAGVSTRRYTDFLLATAWQTDVATIAAAMSPCMRLYLFLGRELAKDGIPDHHMLIGSVPMVATSLSRWQDSSKRWSIAKDAIVPNYGKPTAMPWTVNWPSLRLPGQVLASQRISNILVMPECCLSRSAPIFTRVFAYVPPQAQKVAYSLFIVKYTHNKCPYLD